MRNLAQQQYKKKNLLFAGLPFIPTQSEYSAVYSAMTNKPTGNDLYYQNKLVYDLKNYGIWSKLDLFYVFATHTNAASEALINWANPGVGDYSEASGMIVGFTAHEGITNSNATGYLANGINPSTEMSNWSLNSAHMGFYSRTDTVGNGFEITVTSTSGGTMTNYLAAGTSDVWQTKINDDTFDTYDPGHTVGFFVTSRTASGSYDKYIDGNSVKTPSIASVAVPNSNMVSFSSSVDRQLSFFTFGGGLTPTEVSNFKTALESYMSAFGTNIIGGPEIITNGDFSAWTADDPDNWTVFGESGVDPMITEVSGACRLYSSGAGVYIQQSISLESGATYKIRLNVDTVVSGGITIVIRGSESVVATVNTPGKYEWDYVASASDTAIQIKRATGGGDDATFDDLSMRKVL